MNRVESYFSWRIVSGMCLAVLVGVLLYMRFAQVYNYGGFTLDRVICHGYSIPLHRVSFNVQKEVLRLPDMPSKKVCFGVLVVYPFRFE